MDLKKAEKYLIFKKQSTFRLNQIKEAFYQKSFSGFGEITNLSKDLRDNLSKEFPWLLVKEVKKQGGLKNQVIKSLLELQDGLQIESVLMVYRDWISACLSVMVGCPLNCSFCATGQMGFKRNLSLYEIVDQIVYWNLFLKPEQKRVDRIVFMGMGETFLNWDNVWEAIKIINAKDCLNIGQRHITVSTAGIISKIYEFADLDTEINLAISLHSPFQDQREKIMPIAKENRLKELMKASDYYVRKTNRKLFFEYALIDKFNDRSLDASELKNIFNNKLFHLNIINLNPAETNLKPSDNLKEFSELLDINHLRYTIRRSLGSEINAACGQLAGK